MARQQQQNEVDELFNVRNYFYIGNYQQCINEAQKLKLSSPEATVERDIFVFRSFLAQKKYSIALNEIKDNSPKELQPLKLLAQYFASPEKRETILEQLEKDKYHVAEKGASFRLVAALIYYQEENFDDALRVLWKSDNIECMALSVQIYLKMNRSDLAQSEVKAMQEKDEDATLTQLSLAHVNLTLGGNKFQEAFYIFQELIDKYTPTTLLLNGKANSLALQHKFEEAEEVLQEALEKDSNNPNTLVNMMVVLAHLGKPEEASQRYFMQLKDSHPKHPFVTEYLAKEAEYDKVAQQLEAIYIPKNKNST
ncbi:coatomer subunit epsilon [Trichogramma pretiosum]|uniref:Coatomer subunit epsilon n=1 Tax=Trichogramma kaykai TaxID=54128 RepID=A0ABD2XEL1_9HYME|nr:coatomer subunit epsilon [Trichogramma pretiosum]